MSIASLIELNAAGRERVLYARNYLQPSSVRALVWETVRDVAGGNVIGTLAAGNTTSGVVPTDTTSTFPTIDFTSDTAYLVGVSFDNVIACRLMMYDMLFYVGAISYAGATTTLSSQPSYSSRVPGANYSGLQLWLEVTTGFVTGNNWTVAVSYTNQSGVSGRTATLGPLAAASLVAGLCYQFPLQAGDSGVQQVNSITVTNGTTAMTAGAFNVIVARPLWVGRLLPGGDGGIGNDLPADVHGIERVGMPRFYKDSAVCVMINSDSASYSSGPVDIELDVAWDFAG